MFHVESCFMLTLALAICRPSYNLSVSYYHVCLFFVSFQFHADHKTVTKLR